MDFVRQPEWQALKSGLLLMVQWWFQKASVVYSTFSKTFMVSMDSEYASLETCGLGD